MMVKTGCKSGWKQTKKAANMRFRDPRLQAYPIANEL